MELISPKLWRKITVFLLKFFKPLIKLLPIINTNKSMTLFHHSSLWNLLSAETYSHFLPWPKAEDFISLYLSDSCLLYLNHPPKMDDLSDTQSCPHFLFLCPVWPIGTCHYRWSIFSPCKSPSTTVARPSRAPADVWIAVWARVRMCLCVCARERVWWGVGVGGVKVE